MRKHVVLLAFAALLGTTGAWGAQQHPASMGILPKKLFRPCLFADVTAVHIEQHVGVKESFSAVHTILRAGSSRDRL